MFKLDLLSNRRTIIILSVIGLIIITGLALAYVSAITQPLPPLSDTVTPGPINVTGQMVCLPHKNAAGPQTMECAFGVKADDGRYYGLQGLDQHQLINGNLTTQMHVTVKGSVTRPDHSERYDVAGNILVSSIKPQ